MKISVAHPDLNMIRFEVDANVMPFIQNNEEFYIEVEDEANIQIFFEPWKIKPLLRVNDHLIDYWLADVLQFDHMIQFSWTKDFYSRYQAKNIQSKIDYLGITKQEDIDYYLGINNSHLDIVEQIKKYL
jgi:hypothetical protein